MTELFAVLGITILAVISPGGDFAIVSRNSYLYGKRAGILTALGIATAIWLHVTYNIIGVSLLLQRSPILLNSVKIAGACYLIYLGWQTYHHRLQLANEQQNTQITDRLAFKNGFITNALNPKTTLFVLSLFSQVISTETPLWLELVYGGYISFVHFAWFALVAIFLSSSVIRQRLLAKQQYVNRTIGILLAGLGCLVLFSAFN